MAIIYRDNYNPDGTCYGQAAADKIGFYGTTPAIQPSGGAQAAVSTATLTTIASTTLTSTDLTSLNAIVTRVTALTTLTDKIRADLVTLGLIAGA